MSQHRYRTLKFDQYSWARYSWGVLCLLACQPAAAPIEPEVHVPQVERAPAPAADAPAVRAPTIACELLRACRSDAECTFDGKRCVIGGDADCARTSQCKWFQRCKLANGECWKMGADDAACQKHDPRYSACFYAGLCTSKDGLCVAASDADCAKYPCEKNAQCTARDDRCVATRVEDCVRVGICKEASTCKIVDGECRAPLEDCSGIPCGLYGLCHIESGKCVAKTAHDCAYPCEISGDCLVVEGACVAGNDAHCKQSKICATSGMCHERHGECVALSDADCEKSSGCAEIGSCEQVLGTCSGKDRPASDLL